MKIITHNDITALNISSLTCYGWAQTMIENKNDMLLPKKISMKLGEGIFCNVMPSVVTMPDKRRLGGVKVVTRYPHRVPSLDSKILLFDADSGENLALMDADWITAMRTGAVAVHSLKLFAKKNYKSIGVVGLGNTARAILLVLSQMLNKELTINLLAYKNQEKLFKQRFAYCPYFRFEDYDNASKLVSSSDIVISAVTYLPENLCDDRMFNKGVLVIPIHTLGFTNCDLFFDKVFADDVNHVSHFKYFDKFKSFGEVGEVSNGKIQGRVNDDERIIVYNIGLATHDVYFAANIYDMICKENLKTIDFGTPTDKFWI